ncbi:MAG: hypothetical protein AXA67_11065 [Methylothermaceae bacteria B42]|nr:MAG: hypothetical protein AXA67_11065 [Methylothermaceae bacteria B42]
MKGVHSSPDISPASFGPFLDRLIYEYKMLKVNKIHEIQLAPARILYRPWLVQARPACAIIWLVKYPG